MDAAAGGAGGGAAKPAARDSSQAIKAAVAAVLLVAAGVLMYVNVFSGPRRATGGGGDNEVLTLGADDAAPRAARMPSDPAEGEASDEPTSEILIPRGGSTHAFDPSMLPPDGGDEPEEPEPPAPGPDAGGGA
jgi:hypothetical protein